MVRLYGEIRKVNNDTLSNEEVISVIRDVLPSDKQYKHLLEHHDYDSLLEEQDLGRFRYNIYKTHRGFAINFRIINDTIIPFEELGLPDIVKSIAEMEKGLVLVTGPAGCGKSTTLATLLDLLNKTHKKHILTIEDPVEYIHIPDKAIINHRQVGFHTHSFARALKSALREDPDIILIGELRDLETISLALTAAETGHLVMGTLHTSSAAKTITRLIDAFPPNKHEQIRTMLSESIQMVLSQILMKRKDEKGLVPAFEVMVATTAIKSLIRENKVHQIPSSIETGTQHGMTNLDAYIEQLVKNGIISKEEARKHYTHKENYQDKDNATEEIVELQLEQN
jgi:twitching motility protein PilT